MTLPRSGVIASAHVAASGPPPSAEFLAFRASYVQSNATINRLNVPIGAEDANRKVVVAFAAQTTTNGPFSITIGGVAATQRAYVNSRNRVWIYEAAVPLGTTADIVGSGPTAGNLGMYVWTTTGDLVEAQTSVTNGVTSPGVILFDTLTDDALIAVSMGWSNSAQPTWDGVTEDATGTTSSTNRSSGASGLAVFDTPTVQAFWASASTPSLAVVSYR